MPAVKIVDAVVFGIYHYAIAVAESNFVSAHYTVEAIVVDSGSISERSRMVEFHCRIRIVSDQHCRQDKCHGHEKKYHCPQRANAPVSHDGGYDCECNTNSGKNSNRLMPAVDRQQKCNHNFSLGYIYTDYQSYIHVGLY